MRFIDYIEEAKDMVKAECKRCGMTYNVKSEVFEKGKNAHGEYICNKCRTKESIRSRLFKK